MFTRCPQCNTVFRVTPQQLQASSGQVRCGRCQTPFDAFATLSAQFPADPKKPAAGDRSSIEAAETSGLQSRTQPLPSTPTTVGANVTSPHAVRTREGDTLVSPARQYREEHDHLTQEAQRLGTDADSIATAHHQHEAAEGALQAEAELQLPEGVLDRERPHLPHVKRWRVASAALAGLAMLQGLWVFATPIALALPALRPVLEGVCNVAGCKVRLPRLPDQLFIEASDLQMVNPGRPNEVLLTATVRNRANVVQQLPLVELTLVAGANQTAARKVFRPEEYLQNRVNLEQSIGPSQEIEIRLYLNTGNVLANSY